MNTSCIRRPFGAAALLLLVLFACMPAQAAAGVQNGLVCCAQRVLPALFPFFVVSNLLLSTRSAELLGLLLYPYTRFCLGIRDKQAATALLLSWLGGFAVAASSISQIYTEGRINKREASVLLVCGVGSSPAFVVNTVGLLMLRSTRLGVCLFFALLCSNLVCGILTAAVMRKNPMQPQQLCDSVPALSATSKYGLVTAVGAAVRSSLTVCGFVVFFSGLSHCIQSLLPDSAELYFLVSAVLEVTGGCLSGCALSHTAAPFACCLALSVLSLSVFLQVRALLSPELSLRSLIISRPIHLMLTFLLFKFFLSVIPASQEVISTLQGRIITQSRSAPDAALILFLLCCAVLFFTSNQRWSIIDCKKSRNPTERPRYDYVPQKAFLWRYH